MSSKKQTYATAVHPSIEAVLNGLFRYKTHAQAIERMNALKQHFVLSKEQPTEPHTLLMWIKGFAVSEEELKTGFTGHFALIKITTTEDGKYTVTAARVDKPLEIHPQKKRVIMRHPNWGHPVLRATKKPRVYETMEDAQADLMMLHEEFPEVSIPGMGKLFIIVYGKKEGSKKPINKIALEIQAEKEGKGFIIIARDNEKTTKGERKKPTRVVVEKPAEPGTPKGYFSSLEMIRKEKKKRKFGKTVTIPTLDGASEDPQDS